MNNNKIENIKILFGGAFNPPTYSHFLIGDKFVNKYHASIYYLPTSSIYNKNVEIIDYEHRYKMLELVVNKIGAGAYISEFERNQEVYLGTYQTLKHFADYYFLIGYDQFANLPNWLNFPKLVSECKFIVIPREGYNIKEALNNSLIKENINNFIFVEDDFGDDSSTEFRLTHNKDLLIDEVYEYIKKNKLYEVK